MESDSYDSYDFKACGGGGGGVGDVTLLIDVDTTNPHVPM